MDSSASGRLVSSCPVSTLVRYADDIAGVMAERAVSWVLEYLAEEYGWDSVLAFVVAVVDEPGRVPPLRMPHNYNVGSGVRPGIDSAKPQARF